MTLEEFLDKVIERGVVANGPFGRWHISLAPIGRASTPEAAFPDHDYPDDTINIVNKRSW